jgi:hypothetical protein
MVSTRTSATEPADFAAFMKLVHRHADPAVEEPLAFDRDGPQR